MCVVATIKGGMSRNQAAKRFGVAISTAVGWMKRVDETGSVEPQQISGCRWRFRVNMRSRHAARFATAPS